jgi:hypothetical protein
LPETLAPAQSHLIQLLWRGCNASLFAGEIMAYENSLFDVNDRIARVTFHRLRACVEKRLATPLGC